MPSRVTHQRFFLAFLLAATFAAISLATAQQITPFAPKALTAADYARAEKFLTAAVTPLVSNTSLQPNWLADGRFWYRATGPGGAQSFLVDPERKTRVPCDVPGTPCTPAGVAPAAAAGAGGRGGRGAGGQGRAGGQGGRGGVGAGGAAAAAPAVNSPDGKRAVFIKNDNLFVRDVATGTEKQLTTDGVKDFGYATDNAGWAKSDRPVVVWSPDSKKIFTFQQDQRGVGEMYLVNTVVGHPTLSVWKYPLPGDKIITTIQRVVIDVDAAKVVRVQMPADQHRSTLCDNVNCGNFGDVQWNPNGNDVAFISTSRDHRDEVLYVADVSSGAIRKVFEEHVPTFYESGNGAVNFKYLPASNEFIWFSEQSNWGQIYLYDLTTGKLKNPITSGDGNVTQIEKLDAQNRVVYFYGVGKENPSTRSGQGARDPYFIHFYKVGMDGKNQTLLTPDDGNHGIAWAPSGKYFIDTYSKPDVPQTIALRDADGRLVLPLEKADISKLVAAGWKPPTAVTVKCRDNQTDCYGLMYTPTKLDPTKKYPIVNHIYPGPQTGSVGGRNFNPARGDAQALAELGFVVVEIDGMGTPWRTKKFHEAYYGDMGDNTLPDQVAAMKQLAAKYPYIDIDRAGIYGHSGGGFATAGAMFHYPDFFKVGISESGNHDNREYEDDWAEKWSPLMVTNPDGTTNYDSQANQNFAKNLKGHLLLAHGTMDNNVPPYNTLLVVDALIKANKDFDLLMIPNAAHGYAGAGNYMMRKRWDYFCRYLLGAEPPKEYVIGAGAAGGRGGRGGH
jgi:dipeptidyl aminopeptidase/acylaminoacyl peptidase